MANETPDYTPGIGRLATDRYDFQDHIEGTEFRHNAYSIDVEPPVIIDSQPYIDVADALYALAAHSGGGGGGIVITGTGLLNAISGTIQTAASIGSAGQALFTNSGSSGIQWSGFSGDVTSDALPGVLSVVKIQGNAISSIAPSNGQVLTWNTGTSSWTPETGVSGVTWANDLAGSTNTSQTVVGIQSHPVSATAPTIGGQLFEWSGSAWQPTSSSPSPATNDVLTWNGANWAPAAPGGGGLSITGSGFIHVTSSTIDGAASHGSAGQVAITNTTPDATWQTISGDIRSSASSIGDFTVISINAATVPIAGSLATGNVLQVTGASALSYAPVNLGGGGNYITGTLPLANLTHGANGTFLISNGSAPTWVSLTSNGTDITWNSANPIGDLTVTGIQGNPVAASPAPTAGQFLIENTSATGSSWQYIAGDITNLSPTSSANTLTVQGIQNHSVTASGTYTTGYVLTWNAAGFSNQWSPQPPAAGGTGITALTTTSTGSSTETGDVTTVGQPSPVSGAQPATVVGLQGYKVSNSTPNTFNLLTFNATSGWAPGAVALGQGSSAVTGTLPLANGGIGLSSAPGSGYLLESNSTSTTTWLAPGSAGYVLTISGGLPSWQPPASGSSGVALEWNGNLVGSGFTNLNFVGATSSAIIGSPPYGYIYAFTQGGNSFGINPTIIGTNDDTEFDIYTDDTQRIRVGNTGQIIINAANSGLVTFQVNGAASNYAINVNANTSSGYGITASSYTNAAYFATAGAGPAVTISAYSGGSSIPDGFAALKVLQSGTGGGVISTVTSGHNVADLAYYGASDGTYVEYMYNQNSGIASRLQTNNATTSAGTAASTGTCLQLVSAASDSGLGSSHVHFIDFYANTSTFAGSLCTNGNLAVSLYNASSDKRLKENIKDTSLRLSMLNKINVRQFNYIGHPEIRQGFIAQELYEVIPEAVLVGGENPKTNPWAVSFSELVPLLVKSIQDLSKKVKSLEEDLYEFRDR